MTQWGDEILPPSIEFLVKITYYRSVKKKNKKPGKPRNPSKSKKPKKLSFSRVLKETWNAFSLYIRARDSHTCFTCGSTSGVMQAGHYISRSHKSILFDEKNVHCQCFRCNIWMKGNSDEYAIRLIEKYGDEILHELHQKKGEIRKYTIPELLALKETFKWKLKSLYDYKETDR